MSIGRYAGKGDQGWTGEGREEEGKGEGRKGGRGERGEGIEGNEGEGMHLYFLLTSERGCVG